MTSPFDNLSIDHVRFYVEDLTAATDWLVDGYGLEIEEAGARSAVLRRGAIRLVLRQPTAGDPGAVFLDTHGEGVADIALRVSDVSAAYGEAVGRGAESVSPPTTVDGRLSATVMAFGDVTHTFVQPPENSREASAATGGRDIGLRGVDHVAVCLEADQLEPTVEFYKSSLGFNKIFEEYIKVGEQAMNSAVVQSQSRRVTLTLLAPDPSKAPGQIDEFLKNNAGSGVQHLALSTNDIVAAVGSIAGTGVEFLKTPASYYRMLGERLELARHTVAELQDLSILADQDHDGQLYQIFASSVSPRRTFFMEVIERLGASTFGSNNIQALYEAVEAERHRPFS
ncbi:MAG: 4-hydroxyphenylpyruvate dioxygenase [Jatrophihabitantaceae bacterium]